MMCACYEGRALDGGPLRETSGRERPDAAAAHDCEYIRARNRLIPEASRIADREVKSSSEGDPVVRGGIWSRAFAAAMERLVREKMPGPARAAA